MMDVFACCVGQRGRAVATNPPALPDFKEADDADSTSAVGDAASAVPAPEHRRRSSAKISDVAAEKRKSRQSVSGLSSEVAAENRKSRQEEAQERRQSRKSVAAPRGIVAVSADSPVGAEVRLSTSGKGRASEHKVAFLDKRRSQAGAEDVALEIFVGRKSQAEVEEQTAVLVNGVEHLESEDRGSRSAEESEELSGLPGRSSQGPDSASAPAAKRSSVAQRDAVQAPVRLLPDDSGPGALSPDEAIYACCQMTEETFGGTFDHVALRWSTENSHDLCGLGEESRFEGTSEMLSGIFSVSQAVEHLNVNSHLCPDGRCVVYSQGKQRYFLLYQVDERKKAFSTFGIEDAHDSEEEEQEEEEEEPVAKTEEKVAQWSIGLSHDFCAKGEEARFDGMVPHLTQFSGVSEAVEHLNATSHLCPLGKCIVFSEGKQRYFLLFQAETKRKVLSSFGIDAGRVSCFVPDEAVEDKAAGEDGASSSGEESAADEQQQAWIDELEDADSDDSDYDIEGMFGKMPDKARGDREVALAAIGRSGKSLKHASISLRSDREVILAAVQKCGLMMEYASEPLKDDKAVVMSAVRQDGLALRHAGKELRADKEVVLSAVEQNGQALEFASEELKNDPQVAFAALTQLKVTGVSADSPRREMGRAAVRRSGEFLMCLPQAVREDREILLEAMATKGMALENAPENLRGDKNLVLAACEQNGNALQFAGGDLKADKDVVLTAVRENFYALKFADQSMQDDEEVVTAAIQQNLDFS